MIRVTTRAALKHKILLALGHPYIKVNLSDEHIDMAIDTAMRNFFKYSPYGSYESHYVYTMSQTDVDNGYIPVPKTINAVVEVIPKGLSLTDMSFMTAEYQMTRETFMAASRFNGVSLVDFVTLKQRLYNTQMILDQPKGFTFVRYQRRLIPNFTTREGSIIALKCYENTDPEAAQDGIDPANVISADDLWDDETLKELAVAECKKVWGNILRKYGNVILPGGVSLDGQKMYEEGDADFKKIVNEMLYSNPVDFFLG